jgi:dTDP-4-amino-4,6-dideoxygalactose transaminase
LSEELAINGGPKARTTSFPSVGDSSGRDLGEEEITLLTEVVRSGCLGRHGGRMVPQFEQEYADHQGVKHCLGVTSGTAALHTAVGALQLTTVTDMGTVIAILQQNHIPIFCDVDRRTMNLDPSKLEPLINDRTRAIIAVHLFGQACDMDALMPIARKHNLYVIEDCAQAHDAEWDGRRVGTIGDLGCFSLQQSKQITTGDGGIVITNDDDLALNARNFHDKFYDRSSANRGVLRLGVNYRMTELQGAVALAQTRKLDSILGRRRHTAELLTSHLRGIEGIRPPWVHPKATHSYWIYAFQVDEAALKCTVDEFRAAIQAEGLPWGTGYAGGIPICMYPALREHKAYGDTQFPWEPPYGRHVEYREEDYPETLWAQANTFVMNWNEGITDADVEDMARGFRKVAEYYRARP